MASLKEIKEIITGPFSKKEEISGISAEIMGLTNKGQIKSARFVLEKLAPMANAREWATRSISTAAAYLLIAKTSDVEKAEVLASAYYHWAIGNKDNAQKLKYQGLETADSYFSQAALLFNEAQELREKAFLEGDVPGISEKLRRLTNDFDIRCARDNVEILDSGEYARMWADKDISRTAAYLHLSRMGVVEKAELLLVAYEHLVKSFRKRGEERGVQGLKTAPFYFEQARLFYQRALILREKINRNKNGRTGSRRDTTETIKEFRGRDLSLTPVLIE